MFDGLWSPVSRLRHFIHHSIQSWSLWTHPTSRRLRQSPFARLASPDEVPIAVALGIRINVNQATVDDWLRLPGLSIHQARTLTTLRQHGIAFYCIEDISAALGIPCEQLKSFQPLLQFYYYEPESLTPIPIGLNQATPEQLLALPGMSATLVNRIVRERARSRYTTWNDFHSRLQLTPEQTACWLHYLYL